MHYGIFYFKEVWMNLGKRTVLYILPHNIPILLFSQFKIKIWNQTKNSRSARYIFPCNSPLNLNATYSPTQLWCVMMNNLQDEYKISNIRNQVATNPNYPLTKSYSKSFFFFFIRDESILTNIKINFILGVCSWLIYIKIQICN